MKRLARLSSLLPASSLGAARVRAAPRAPAWQWRGWDRGPRGGADSSERPVLVDVYTDWCGWCQRMDADVYSRADVRDYLPRKFVTVKLNAEAADAAHYEGKALHLALAGRAASA